MNKHTNTIVYVRQHRMDDVFVPVRRIAHIPEAASRSQHTAYARPLMMVAAVLVFALCLSMSRIGSTVAYFTDTEISSGNLLRAGLLDFTVSNDAASDVYVGIESAGGKTLVPELTPLSGSFPVDYSVTVQQTGGVDALCSALQVTATSSPFSYSGPLLGLSTGSSTVTGAWSFALALPPDTVGLHEGDVCNVDLVYSGSVAGDTQGGGYHDVERVPLAIHARMIVLNEFLPNPEGLEYGFDFGTDAGTMPQGEWIELYNNSTSSVNLTGWTVGNLTTQVPITAANTIPATTTISAHAWLAVYMNAALLDNTADTVVLKNAASAIEDARAYDGAVFCTQQPTADGANATTTASGSCATVSGNKSFARIPDGTGAWVDPIPTPGYANVDESSIVHFPSLSPDGSTATPASASATDTASADAAATDTPPSTSADVATPTPTPTATATATPASTSTSTTDASASTNPTTTTESTASTSPDAAVPSDAVPSTDAAPVTDVTDAPANVVAATPPSDPAPVAAVSPASDAPPAVIPETPPAVVPAATPDTPPPSSTPPPSDPPPAPASEPAPAPATPA